MKRLFLVPDDFEAEIRIFRQDEGGRKTPPFNGIRWDFSYAGDDIDEVGLHMIYPDFYDENGDSLPTDAELPIDTALNARMAVLSDELRATIHSHRAHQGVRFFCHEGRRRVAEGVIRGITGLNEPREMRE
nr:putative integron gene cassette protein [uncultured bacterium]